MEHLVETPNKEAYESLWTQGHEEALRHYAGVNYSGTLLHTKNNYQGFLVSIRTLLTSTLFEYARRKSTRRDRRMKPEMVTSAWDSVKAQVLPDENGNFLIPQDKDFQAIRSLAVLCRKFEKVFLQTRTDEEEEDYADFARVNGMKAAIADLEWRLSRLESKE